MKLAILPFFLLLSLNVFSEKVYFINIKDGDVLKSPFLIQFGLRGKGVAPAGVDVTNTGHHHLLINVDEVDYNLPIPSSDQHLHFGLGQTETNLELPSGKHSLQLVLGDKYHIPHKPPLMSEKIQIDYNFAIDNDFSTFEKNSVDLKFSVNNLITNFGFSEENGEMGDSNVLSNTTLYKFDDNNYLSFGTRRNRKINLTEYYDLVYEYKNDCLTAGIKYRKTYYSDRDAKPTEDLLLTLTLFPLVTLEQDVEQNFYRENDLFN